MLDSPDAPQQMQQLTHRLQWVRSFRHLVEQHADELCALMHEEIGKPLHEGLTGDVWPLLGACRWHEKHAKNVLRSRRVRGRSLFQLSIRQQIHRAPIGKIAIIAVWNYPIQLLGIQMLQAITAGNRVTIKPSEHSGKTQGRLVELAGRAGADELIEILPPTREAGEQLVEAGDFDKLIFTGSTRTGRAIARVLADRLIPSSLELSGCDSAIVLADANPELAARVIVNAVRMNRGQTCMAPRRVIVDAAVRAEFVESLKRAVNSESESSDPAAGVVTPGEAGRVRSMIESHKTAGCEVLIDDTIAVLLDVEGDSELARGEWFAPLLTIISARNEEEAIAIHRQHEQHLTTSVFTTTPDRAKRIAVALTSSNITINDCILPIAHPGVGIAGRGPSGWGITQGESGLLSMTHEVVVSKTPGRFRIPPEPPSEEQVSMLRRGMRYIYGNRSGRAGLTSVTRSNGNGSE